MKRVLVTGGGELNTLRYSTPVPENSATANNAYFDEKYLTDALEGRLWRPEPAGVLEGWFQPCSRVRV